MQRALWNSYSKKGKIVKEAVKEALCVRHLTVNYDKTPVLWDIDLTIPSGQIAGVIGPNGAGKTTLLKACLGLQRILHGKVEFFGLPLEKVRTKIAYVPQKGSVDWDFPITVAELVLMGCYGRLQLFQRPSKKDRALAAEMLDSVGIASFADRQISQLSGGQQQRAFLARALMQDADLYLLDEPFTGIDMVSESAIMNLLRKLKSVGKTAIVIHHDLDSVESYFDWLVVLNRSLIASGPKEKVFTSEVLARAYGKTSEILGEALRLTKKEGV